MKISQKTLLKMRDAAALAVLVLIAHGYEALSYVIGNLFAYYLAVFLFAAALLPSSLALIYLHDFFKKRYDWDALGLDYINSLRDEEEIPPYRVFSRLTRFILRKGYWAIFVFGPIFLGPFVVTVLLRRRKTWRTHLFYAASGSFFSALFKVALMKGVGAFTWHYVTEWPKLLQLH